MQVNHPSQINIDTIEFSDMNKFGEQAKIVYINHDSKPIIIQTPEMVCPYGIGKYEGGDVVKYSLDVSFRGKESNPSIERFYNFLKRLDEKVLDASTEHSLVWFKKKNQSKDVSEALFTPSIKVATENGEPTDKYPPTFKAKIKEYDGKLKVLCYNDEKEQMNEDLRTILNKGQSVRAIVRLVGIWFAGGKFGLNWEYQQLKFTPRVSISEYSFVDDDDDEVCNKNNPNENYIIDSEDDEENEL